MIPENELQRMINIHGYLKHEIGLYLANGLKPKASSISDLQKIEAHVQSQGTPLQIKHAETQSQAVEAQQRDQYDKGQTALQQKQFQNEVDAENRQLTQHLPDGVKFSDVRDGKTTTIGTGKRKFDRAALEKQCQEKYGCDWNEISDRADHLSGLKAAGNRGQYEKQLKQYGLTDGFVDTWSAGGGVMLGMQERWASADKDEGETWDYTPDDQDQRKAQIQDAWMEHQHGDDEIPSDLNTSIHEGVFANDNDGGDGERLADIGRAWDACENA